MTNTLLFSRFYGYAICRTISRKHGDRGLNSGVHLCRICNLLVYCWPLLADLTTAKLDGKDPAASEKDAPMSKPKPRPSYESNLTRLIASARNECSRALVRLRVAESGGEARAQAALGFLYASASPKARHKVTKQPEEAARCFRCAAGQGHSVSQLNLGVMSFQGWGISRNQHAALHWLSCAAAQGHGRARTMALQISKASSIRSSGVFVRLKGSTLRFCVAPGDTCV